MASDYYPTPAQQVILDQAWMAVGECIKAEPPPVIARIDERLRAIDRHDYLTNMNRIWTIIAAIKQESSACGAQVNNLLALIAIVEPERPAKLADRLLSARP